MRRFEQKNYPTEELTAIERNTVYGTSVKAKGGECYEVRKIVGKTESEKRRELQSGEMALGMSCSSGMLFSSHGCFCTFCFLFFVCVPLTNHHRWYLPR